MCGQSVPNCSIPAVGLLADAHFEGTCAGSAGAAVAAEAAAAGAADMPRMKPKSGLSDLILLEIVYLYL